MIVYALLILNLLTVIWVVRRACFTKDGIEFNHVLMFSFGYVFYWILPIVVGSLHLFRADLRMHLWYGIYDQISLGTLILYLTICLTSYLGFYLGSEWMRRWVRPAPYRRFFFYRSLLNIPLLLGTIAACAFAFLLRDGLFKGYVVGFDPTHPQSLVGRGATTLYGSFTASGVMLLPLTLLYALKRHEDSDGRLTFRQSVLNHFFFIYFFFAILILSLGGREWFLCSVFMLLIYRSIYFRPITRRAAFSVLGGIVCISGLFGLVRLGNALSIEGAMMNIFLEPLWSGFSLIHFLAVNTFEVVRFPIFLLSNFLNLVPWILLPNKAFLMLDPADYGYVAFSPGGALNSFFSFMINFGVLGTIIVLFFTGAFLSYLRARDRNLLFRVVYIMLSGWLGFTFFREPFPISIVKTMFQFSFLEPVFVVVCLQVISTLIRRHPQGVREANSVVSS